MNCKLAGVKPLMTASVCSLFIGQSEIWTGRQWAVALYVPQLRRWLSRVLWNSSGYIRHSGKEWCRLRPGRPHGLWRLFHRGEVYSWSFPSMSWLERTEWMSFEYVRSRKHIHFAFGTIGIREHIQSLSGMYTILLKGRIAF